MNLQGEHIFIWFPTKTCFESDWAKGKLVMVEFLERGFFYNHDSVHIMVSSE